MGRSRTLMAKFQKWTPKRVVSKYWSRYSGARRRWNWISYKLKNFNQIYGRQKNKNNRKDADYRRQTGTSQNWSGLGSPWFEFATVHGPGERRDRRQGRPSGAGGSDHLRRPYILFEIQNCSRW